MDTFFVYCTCESLEQAKMIAKEVVSQRLAACANILPKMISFYWWKDSIVEENEVVLVFKTKRGLFESLTTLIKQLHSYEIPCVIGLPILAGNPEYLQWIENETIPES
jgi:periplasmic divalent cation tolerance protein